MTAALFTILLSISKGRVSVDLPPGGNTPREFFDSYRNACYAAGFRYDGTERTQRGEINRIGDVVAKLDAVGFTIKTTRDIHEAVEGQRRALPDPATHLRAQLAQLEARNLHPRPYQLDGILYLSRKRALLHDDMGLGKTMQTLLAIPEGGCAIVVCPANVKGVWARECKLWRPDLTPVQLDGVGSFRHPVAGEIVVTNYELLEPFKLNEKQKVILAQLGTPGGNLTATEVCGHLAPELDDDGNEIEDDSKLEISEIACRSNLDKLVAAGYVVSAGAGKKTYYEKLAKRAEQNPLLAGTVLVDDEAHKAKNTKAKRTKLVRKLSKAVLALDGYVWNLTGTPMLNRPGELWNVLEINGLGREAFGDFDNFLRVFNGRRDGYNNSIVWYELGDADEHDEYGALTVKCRDEAVELIAKVAFGRLKSVVAKDLPAKLYQDRVIPVAGKAVKAMDAFANLIERAGHSVVNGIIVDKQGEPVSLKDLTGDKMIFEQMSAMRAAVAAVKIDALLDCVEDYEENGEALVVFSAHRAPVNELGRRAGWDVITGDMTADQKTAVVDRFQAGELLGVACTNAAVEGITLTRASNMIFVDRFWTPGLNAQAEDRIHRIGQTETCMYVDLVADHPIDALVLDLLRIKANHVETVHQAAELDAPDNLERARLERVLRTEVVTKKTPGKKPAAVKKTAPTAEPGPLKAIVDFLTAVTKKKYPRVDFTHEGKTYRAALCSSRSKYAGQVRIIRPADDGYFGQIDTDGYPRKGLERCAPLLETLATFAANPANALKAYGDHTHSCGLCALELEVGESVRRGYGPDCAANHGLPFDFAVYARELAARKAHVAKGGVFSDDAPGGVRGGVS